MASKESKTTGAGDLTVVTWNLAGINSNAFEFAFCNDDRYKDGVSFGRFLNQLIRAATIRHEGDKYEEKKKDTTTATKSSKEDGGASSSNSVGSYTTEHFAKLVDVTNASLLAPLLAVSDKLDGKGHVKKGISIALKGILNGPQGSSNVSESLRAAWHGDSGFSKADLFFKERTWSFTNLRTSNISAFFKSCDPTKDPKTWWELWLTDLSNTSAFRDTELRKLMQKWFVPIAIFDGLLYLAIRFALESKQWKIDRLIRHVEGFVGSMNVDVDKKATGISSALSWVVDAYRPDVVSLQENNLFWQKRPQFHKTWKKTIQKEYHVLEPQKIENPQQVVQLLIRKRGERFRYSKKRTAHAQRVVSSERFLAKVRAKLGKICGNFTDQMLDEQIRVLRKVVRTRWVPAVLDDHHSSQSSRQRRRRTRKRDKVVLVCGAHANSKGTDNRAIVAVTTLLARELGECDVVLAMDANSNNTCKAKDVAHGAATRKLFNSFVHSIGLNSCFPDGDNRNDGKCFMGFHTVKKERTFLQMQLKKAEKIDQSLKDWVVSDFSFGKSVRVNNFMGPAVWSEDNGQIWLEADCMPNSHCPSDHCMLISRVHCRANGDGALEESPAEGDRPAGCCVIS
eukprot:g4014.t1